MKKHHILMLLFGVVGVAVVYHFAMANNAQVSAEADTLGFSRSSRAMNYAGTK